MRKKVYIVGSSGGMYIGIRAKNLMIIYKELILCIHHHHYKLV